jgi:hypothetical protein
VSSGGSTGGSDAGSDVGSDAGSDVGSDVGDVAAELQELLDAEEVAGLARRCQLLARRGRMPVPSGSWPSIPWPAF